MIIFAPQNDQELREGIRGFYAKLHEYLPLREPVMIKLPMKPWISANALNMLLIFIEAFRLHNPESKIFVELIDNKIVQRLLTRGKLAASIMDHMYYLRNKLIYYEKIRLLELLRVHDVVVKPDGDDLDIIKEKIKAHVRKSYFEY